MDLKELIEMSWGWRSSVLMLQAHSAGVFDALAGGRKSAEDVAASLGADHRATRLVLIGLCGVGLVEKDGDTFGNAPVVERYLVKGVPEYRGHVMELDRRSLTNWLRIQEVMRSGEPIPKPETTDEQALAWQETFILAMDDIASQRVDAMFKAIPLKDGDRFLDIGCGSGTYTREFLKRLPKARAVAFDRPLSEAVVTDTAAKAGVLDRVTFKGGDFTTDNFEFSEPFDWALLSQVIHMLSAGQAEDLIRRASSAVRPGGFVAVHEMTLGPDNNPGPGAVFAVQMMLGTAHGSVYTVEEISGMLATADLAVESTTRTDGRSKVVIGRKVA